MQIVNKTLAMIEDIDQALLIRVQQHLDNLTKPRGSLGRLEEIAKRAAGIIGNETPRLNQKVIFTLAADHGVAGQGVSAFPQEVTAQMVYNFLAGGAGINVLARHIGGRVIVCDIGVKENLIPNSHLKIKKINFGTKDITIEPAMSKQEAVSALETGIALIDEEISSGIDIAGIGEMGIGNTTSAAAVTAAITGTSVREVTGRGTGINDEILERKTAVIEHALNRAKTGGNDGLEILRQLGGFEIGGMAGIIIACASRRIPIVIDGFISGAAALIAFRLNPKVRDYMIASHCSVEPGHKIILNYLNLRSLLNLDMRLGEGTGAALGISIVEASVKILTEMATFKTANVCGHIEDKKP